jgi:cell division protein FtsZ
VKASVFDDDFFKPVSSQEDTLYEENGLPSTGHFSAPVRVRAEDVRSVTEEVSVAEPTVLGASFRNTVENAEPDELDIPAFLRRGN